MKPDTLNIDFKGGDVKWNLFEDHITLTEDMLWVKYPNFHLDVGWYQDTFILYILDCKDDVRADWENHPLEKSFIQNIQDLEYKINTAIDYWTSKII
jgi:hypothetical protein